MKRRAFITLLGGAAAAWPVAVFLIVGDPVQFGLVAILNRPGGDLTGATFYVAQLVSRQLEGAARRSCLAFNSPAWQWMKV